jgi:RES domain-containing protein
MLLYRIQKSKYATDISGFGSTLVAGRWHQAGKNPILYTSCNISLAILECVVHLPPTSKVPDLLLLTLKIPDNALLTIPPESLPENWNKKGYHDDVQRWGTAWLQSATSLAVKVPSVTSRDYNVLINPAHTDFRFVEIIESTTITFDERLL